MKLIIVHRDGEKEEHKVNHINDLYEVFNKYPMTEEIAKHHWTLKGILNGIAEYLSNHWIDAYVDNEPENLWKSNKFKKLLNSVEKGITKKALVKGIAKEISFVGDCDMAKSIAMNNLAKDAKYYDKQPFIIEESLEKVNPIPKSVGEMSEDGLKEARHYKPLGKLFWHYKPEIAANYDKEVDTHKEAFLNTVPETHRETVSKFIDMVRNDPDRHWVPTKRKSGPGAPETPRIRHIRSLMRGADGYNLHFKKDPNEIYFTIDERHGSVPYSSRFQFHKNFPKVFDLKADKKIIKEGRLHDRITKTNPRNV